MFGRKEIRRNFCFVRSHEYRRSSQSSTFRAQISFKTDTRDCYFWMATLLLVQCCIYDNLAIRNDTRNKLNCKRNQMKYFMVPNKKVASILDLETFHFAFSSLYNISLFSFVLVHALSLSLFRTFWTTLKDLLTGEA